MPAYVERFKKAFPENASPVFDNITKAIEAFEATLITPASALTNSSRVMPVRSPPKRRTAFPVHGQGLLGLHNGINVGGEAYFPLGWSRSLARILPTNDKGRFAVTKTASDEYVFRAAPLRNVALRAPYFHSGQVWSLKQAVGIMGADQLGIKLTEGSSPFCKR